MVISVWQNKAKFLRVMSLNNRFLNIYKQCIIKTSFLSCKYKMKCIINERCALCWMCCFVKLRADRHDYNDDLKSDADLQLETGSKQLSRHHI